MSIEYTYPEPTRAAIRGKHDSYDLWKVVATDFIRVGDYAIYAPDVPEVCEAMMRLAGHDVEHACVTDVGKRIIARLEKEQVSHSSYKYGLEHAARVIREECGL